jgi:uncharacterized protein YdhG (YjbR/CyaY superfamily)
LLIEIDFMNSTTKTRPKTMTDYIDNAPAEARHKLRQMRECIRKAAPDATEGLKWGMPAFSQKRILLMFALRKKHIGFYPTASAVKAFAKELAVFEYDGGAVRFPLEKPLPLTLIRRIAEFRVHESLQEDAKWRTK